MCSVINNSAVDCLVAYKLWYSGARWVMLAASSLNRRTTGAMGGFKWQYIANCHLFYSSFFLKLLSVCFVLFAVHFCNIEGEFELVGGSRRWGTRCTYDFNSQPQLKTGRFFSRAYPQNYPANTRCLYVFYGQRHERVRVHFSRVELEFFDGRFVWSYLFISVI